MLHIKKKTLSDSIQNALNFICILIFIKLFTLIKKKLNNFDIVTFGIVEFVI